MALREFFVFCLSFLFMLNVFLQLNGRQPEFFFAAVSEAIMTISDCTTLVHVLDIENSSESSQFCSLLSDHFLSGYHEQVQFPFAFTR